MRGEAFAVEIWTEVIFEKSSGRSCRAMMWLLYTITQVIALISWGKDVEMYEIVSRCILTLVLPIPLELFLMSRNIERGKKEMRWRWKPNDGVYLESRRCYSHPRPMYRNIPHYCLTKSLVSPRISSDLLQP